MKSIEETENCFILDLNPFDSIDIAKLSITITNDDDDVDISVLAEKGQVVCRDYPHSRHLCLQFPFDTTPHDRHCDLVAVPCEYWMAHCHASGHCEEWKSRRHVSVRIRKPGLGNYE